MIKSISLGDTKINKAYLGSEIIYSSFFDPLELFADGKQGVWYDPSDKSTLFQDVAGTVPVTKDGDPVALMQDKSGNNNHAVQTVSTSRPVYKTDGILHWLEFDGVDDYLSTSFNHKNEQTMLSAVSVPSGSDTNTIFGGRSLSRTRSFFALNSQKAYIGVGSTYESGVSEKELMVGSKQVIGFKYTVDTHEVNTLSKSKISGNTTWSGTVQPSTNSFLGAMNDKGSANYLYQGSLYGIVVVADIVDVSKLSDFLCRKAGVPL